MKKKVARYIARKGVSGSLLLLGEIRHYFRLSKFYTENFFWENESRYLILGVILAGMTCALILLLKFNSI